MKYRDIFSLPLNPKDTRPIVKVYSGFDALIDTGADIPMCFISEEVLRTRFYASEIPLPEGTSVHGIGGDAAGRVFQFREFVLGELVFPNIRFFLPNKPLSTHFLISASMLNGLDYEIRNSEKRIYISIPEGESNIRKVQFLKNGTPFSFPNILQ